MVYVLSEPIVGRTAATAQDTFLVRQQITDEISFQTTAADVTMAGSIQGVSGGQATGSTFAVVRSNSNSGFTIDLAFENNPAMLGETTGNTGIRNYGPSPEPTYGFNSSTSAQFAYTVSASSSSDLDPSFLNNGSTDCNSGSTYTPYQCWKGPATTDFRIINRNSSAPNGATTTLTFRIVVPSNPSPALDEDFYTATATLTATNQ
jgi:hypothetical protein